MTGRALALAGTLAGLAMLLSPVAAAPTARLLGAFDSEAATHVPVLAAAIVGLPEHGPFFYADHPLHPELANQAMLEPVTVLAMAPVQALVGGVGGFALAWNLWLAAGVVAAAAGAWIGARAWLGEDDAGGWGAGLAATLAACGLFHQLAPEVGRTETFAWAFYGLHLGLLVRAATRGRGWALAAASVVPVVWSGGYATVFAALADAGVALWLFRRVHLRGFGAVALTAGLAATPLLLALRARPYAALGERVVSPSIDLPLLLAGAPDLTQVLPGYEVAPFVGWATLFAAVLAGSRRAAAPLAVGGVLLLVAAGPAPTVLGQALPGPAALLAALPGPFGQVRSWPRVVAFAIPLLALAGARAGARHPALAVALALAAVVEAAWRTRGGEVWTLAEHTRITTLHAAGEVPLALPLDGRAQARRWLAPPAGPDPWTVSDEPLVRFVEDLLPSDPQLFQLGARAPARADACALRASAFTLHERGFTGLLVPEDPDRVVAWKAAQRGLRDVLGAGEDWWPFPQVADTACTTRDAGPRDATPLTPEEREARRAERRRILEERR